MIVRRLLVALAVYFCPLVLSAPRTCSAGDLDTGLPNVAWSFPNMISACPAGDSVVVGHPCQLRILVDYDDDSETPKIGVPPESIYVEMTSDSGTIQVNDEGVKTYAADSTYDGFTHGVTRIIVPSFSGSGKLKIQLVVSGHSEGFKYAYIRTTDTNHDGRMTTADQTGYGDINYSNSLTGVDQSLIAAHYAFGEHSHRLALHGQPSRRTNLRDTAPYASFNTIGAGGICWSPSGRLIAYSSMDTCPQCPVLARNRCRIQVARSDGHDGDVSRQISYAASLSDSVAADSVDYDPAWSPIDNYIYYVRSDLIIHRKGLPGYSSDTSDVSIIGGTGSTYRTYLSVSPNGDSLAYAKLTGGHFHVFIASAAGGYERQITTDDANYYYPTWSPDGARIVVQRQASGAAYSEVHICDLRTGAGVQYFAPDAYATFPSFSPDSAIIVAGVADDYDSQVTTALDGTAGSPETGVLAYAPYTSSALFPRLSPDGTRLAMLARDPGIPDAIIPQVFAVRRNMNAPPLITQIGSQTLADSTVHISINCAQGLGSSITVSATDSDTDSADVVYVAAFLKDGMSFNNSTHVLSWTPSAAIGTAYDVKFYVTTPSGGTDAAIATLTVTSNSLLARGVEVLAGKTGLNGVTYLPAELASGAATLEVFDVLGRRVNRIVRASREGVAWSGDHSNGTRVASGVYLYRLLTGAKMLRGRVIIIH